MHLVLQYHNGIIGYNLPQDLEQAMIEAVDRCNDVSTSADIINSSNASVVAEIRPSVHDAFRYVAKQV